MIRAFLLGNAQDAGVPQAGCICANCQAAWHDAAQRKKVSALALLDADASAWFLVDATPDFREQFRAMQTRAPQARFAGILLTHAHIGHYTGLIHLGLEAMNARGVPVYATPRLSDFLRANLPWRQLIEKENILLRAIAPDESFTLTTHLQITPLSVPHRDEFSDTVAFVARGESRALLYLPDIDDWAQWSRDVRAVVESVDIALLDGTFFDADELPQRAALKIGHPLVTDTAARLAGIPRDVRIIHLNHTNPLHPRGDARAWLEAQGLRVGAEDDTWDL